MELACNVAEAIGRSMVGARGRVEAQLFKSDCNWGEGCMYHLLHLEPLKMPCNRIVFYANLGNSWDMRNHHCMPQLCPAWRLNHQLDVGKGTRSSYPGLPSFFLSFLVRVRIRRECGLYKLNLGMKRGENWLRNSLYGYSVDKTLRQRNL